MKVSPYTILALAFSVGIQGILLIIVGILVLGVFDMVLALSLLLAVISNAMGERGN